MIPLPWRARPTHQPQPPTTEDVLLADEFLSLTERQAMVALYRGLTGARKEVARNWPRKYRREAAGFALPFGVPLPSFVLWVVMVAAFAILMLIPALFAKAIAEGVQERGLRAAAVAKVKAVLRRRPTEAVPDDGA